MVAAINARGIPKFVGDLRKKLAQQENAESVRHERNRKRPIGVDPGAAW